jgi:RNA polymerase-binding transcription factor DksA
MSQLMSTESHQDVPEFARVHPERWQRLQDERRFRAEQLAGLDAELATSDRHDCVKPALRIAATSALAEVDGALARIAEGRYGFCVNCAERITDERLDVLPMTSLCMSCHYNAQNCHRAATMRAAGGELNP